MYYAYIHGRIKMHSTFIIMNTDKYMERKCFNNFYIKLFIMRYGHIQPKNLHNRNLAFIPFLQLAPSLPYDRGKYVIYLLCTQQRQSFIINLNLILNNDTASISVFN